jgi:methyl-accepting chemotaxis protein
MGLIAIDTQASTVAGQVILFLTTILGFAVAIYRENRNRKWAEEDRKRLAEEMRANTRVTKETAAKVEQLPEKMKTQADELNATLDKITATHLETAQEASSAATLAQTTAKEAKETASEVKETLGRIETKVNGKS